MIFRFVSLLCCAFSVFAAGESLRYSINWSTGLSLGEASLTSDNIDPASAAPRKMELRLEASIPGFAVLDEFRSVASGSYCSTQFEKSFQHGKKMSKETLVFDQAGLRLERKTDKGGKSESAIASCAKDALAWIYFLRHELRNGRLPAPGPAYFGAAYQLDFKHLGTANVPIGGAPEQADRFQVNIKGPASQHSIEIFIGKDAARTPLLFKAPLPLGSFNMELLR
jgi:hypothetical protein